MIGGVAAVLRGSAHLTLDLDICYNRTPDNFQKLIAAIQPIHPRLRNAPPDLPFVLDQRSLKNGLNFTFDTDLGELDILGEVGGIGLYKSCMAASTEEMVFGVQCLVLNIDGLIRSKKFAGRKKDEPVINELEAIQELLTKRK